MSNLMKKRGLGRGLDALLGAAREVEPDGTDLPEATEDGPAAGLADDDGHGQRLAPREQIRLLPVDVIQRGRYQPRREFDPDSLRELADSIAAQGVLQPIIVRPVEDGRYEIIAGERRWRAVQQVGLATIPAVVREVDEQTVIAIALIENIQRADLRPLEEATALSRLLTEFGLTHQQVADAVGKSRTMVTNLLRLLELNDDVKGYLQDGRLEMGHARALLGLRGPTQSAAALEVVAKGLSVRDTEKLVRRLLAGDASVPVTRPTPPQDPDIRRLQDDLTDRLGARVQIQHGARGTGRLVIAYNSLDELDGILAHIK